MKFKHSQKGFAGMTVLLLLAVVLVIAGIGTFVFTKNSKNIAATNAATPLAQTASGNSTAPGGVPGGANQGPDTAPSAAAGTVIKITEAGFQITVPNSLKDLTYHNNNGVVNFSSASVTSLVPACAANKGTGAFNTITKGAGTYKPPANSADGALLKQYSSYYLAYTLPTGPCAKGLSVEAQNLLSDQAQAFYGSLQSVSAL